MNDGENTASAFTCVTLTAWLGGLCVLVNVVRVWREAFSHVEGVVGRQRRVWTVGCPLAPSTAAIALQSERCGIMSRCPHAPAPPVESSWAWTVWMCEWFTWASKCEHREVGAFSGSTLWSSHGSLWAQHTLHTDINGHLTLLTLSYCEKETFVIFASLRVKSQILLKSQANDRLLWRERVTVSTSRKHRRVGVDYLMKGGICAAVVVEGESLL